MRAASTPGVTRTPPRRSGHAQPQVMSTPPARGSSSQMDLVDNHKVADINNYLIEDVNDRALLPLTTFLKLTLFFGDADLKKRRKLFEKVQKSERFQMDWNFYSTLCANRTSTEQNLYEPLLKVLETALEGLFNQQPPFMYFNGGDRIILGSYARRKPDLPAVPITFGLNRQAKNRPIHWPMVDPFGKLKLTPMDKSGQRLGSALDWGDQKPGSAPVNLPKETEQRYPLRSRIGIETPPSLPTTFPTMSQTQSLSPIPETSTTDEEVEAGKKQKKRKKAKAKQNEIKQKALGDEMEPVEENALSRSDIMIHTLLQCAGYGLESLSCGLLRCHTHAFVMDGPYLQLCYYDRSKVVLSAPVNLLDDGSMILFLAYLYQLGDLPDEKKGIFPSDGEGNTLPVVRPRINEMYTPGNNKRTHPEGAPVVAKSLRFPGSNAFNGCEMVVKGKVLLLDEMAFRAHALVGRGTTVIKAKWEGKDVMVKLSFSGARRTAEDEFVQAARDKAKELGHDWALDHLPDILWSAEYDLADQAETQLAAYFDQKGIPYERRVLRVAVQEILTPITDAVLDPQDYAQIFFDILQIHRWLVDRPRILHRDISLANIMFRRKDGKIYGVLIDFDLASFLFSMSTGAMSRQRTGTKPYMPVDLLGLVWVYGHRYRHDLEALFYVILIFCSNYEPDKKGKHLVRARKPRFQKWFTASFKDVHDNKQVWLTENVRDIQLTKFFDEFRTYYLVRLRSLLKKGNNARSAYGTELDDLMERKEMQNLKRLQVPFTEPFPQEFDWETLNGNVTYENFRDVMQTFFIPTSSGEFDSYDLASRYSDHLPLDSSAFGPLPDSEALENGFR